MITDELRERDLPSRFARYLIQCREADRLPSVRELARLYKVSSGAVSQALQELEEAGAAKLGRHGRMGSTVDELNLGRLWWLSERRPMVMAHTLPSTLRFEGLATGLKSCLTNAGVETYLIFTRGSCTRMKALLDRRCDVALMSELSASQLVDQDAEIALVLPPGSWLSGHRVCYRLAALQAQRRLRVAVDRDSLDHVRISEVEFAGQDVEFIHVPFTRFAHYIGNGFVDALVWMREDVEALQSDELVHKAVSEETRRTVGASATSAALVVRKGDTSVGAILRSVIDADHIVAVEREVENGDLLPMY